jgi:hypothetical protein
MASASSGTSLTITCCAGSTVSSTLSGVRAHLEPYYSDVGRPSIDPQLMIRMLIVGYCFGIRSERRLCEEGHCHTNRFYLSLLTYTRILHLTIPTP